jgi:HK97 family phage prohead protease
MAHFDKKAMLVDLHARRERLTFDTALSAKAMPTAAAAGAVTDDPGWIEGYLATFGDVDQLGETFAPGAFARTLQCVKNGDVPFMARHFAEGGDVLEAIGTITQAREDARGLWIHADLYPTQLAQDVRGKVLRKEAKFLSAGFLPTENFDVRPMTDAEAEGVIIQKRYDKAGNRRPVLIHREVKLAEGTVTLRPVNPNAVITSAKSLRYAPRGSVVRVPLSSAAAIGADLRARQLRFKRLTLEMHDLGL